MSELASWDAVDRFSIGEDGEVAKWISQVRSRPMSVLLLDEFEKAAPEIQDTLLTALDEGRITDRFGRVTTLCGCIIVLTSNVGSSAKSSVGFGQSADRRTLAAIEQEFRPEFLNRLDEVVLFESLTRSHIEQIVEKELQSLSQRSAILQAGLRLVWNAELVSELADIGFDPMMGARPLQRAIEQRIAARIARLILSSDNAGDGNSQTIDLSDLLSRHSNETT